MCGSSHSALPALLELGVVNAPTQAGRAHPAGEMQEGLTSEVAHNVNFQEELDFDNWKWTQRSISSTPHLHQLLLKIEGSGTKYHVPPLEIYNSY